MAGGTILDVDKMLAELRLEREQIEEAILTLERLARGRGRRRGRPPAWLKGSGIGVVDGTGESTIRWLSRGGAVVRQDQKPRLLPLASSWRKLSLRFRPVIRKLKLVQQKRFTTLDEGGTTSACIAVQSAPVSLPCARPLLSLYFQ